MSTKPGLYRTSIEVRGDGIVGAPTVTLDLVVDAASGEVFGRGRIQQAVAPPGGDSEIPSVHGQIHHTGLGQDTLLVALSGHYAIPFGPTMPGQTECMLTAALAIDASWNGHGMFHYGPGGRSFCRDASVTSSGGSAAG
ncbi:MAG TPA: DUF1842 domain-containing protein [Allosphingosinicella sp.]|jgi:hypothetical protein